ncbi:MAG: AhpC/TSA family protein [Deltaproteobacteria bacterium]|nr:AhpC/TSA family protein [Deltaproteobacteria bacterium]
MNVHRVAVVLAGVGIAAPATSHAAEAPSCTARAPVSAEAICPLLPGTKSPDVQLRTLTGATTSLVAALDGKPAVVIFYRGGWCPFCNVQLGALQSIEPELAKLGVRVIGVSPDRPEKLQESIGKHQLTFTLLSDSSMCAAQAFGVAFKVDDATIERYRAMKLDLEGDSGEKHHLLPVPSVFVVDPDGTIRFSYVNPNYKVRLDPQLLLAAARSPAWSVPLKKP